MANDISGNVTGKIAFRIDKKSWDNLALFQKKMTSVKRQMSGLKGSIKVNAVVNSINKVTKATEAGYKKINKAKGKLGSSRGDVSHLFPDERNRSNASTTRFADMLRREEAQAIKARTNVHAAEIRDFNNLQRRKSDIQSRWDRRRFERAKREQHIEYRASGMEHAFKQRFGAKTSGYNNAMSEGSSKIAKATGEYRRGIITMKQYNQTVTQATQSAIRQGVINKQNATTFRSLRTDLLQATAAYTAFSVGANIFNTGKHFDSLKASMQLFAGDEAGVADTMTYLRGESERLGTNLEAAAENFTKFSIVARNKMSQTQRQDFFSGFSEYATVLQVDQHRFARGMMAIQQMMSKSKVSSEELRLQLAENIPGFSIS
jgi:hypothetical protein